MIAANNYAESVELAEQVRTSLVHKKGIIQTIPVEDISLVDGFLPSAIVHSILLMVGNLYANREPVAYTSVVKVPYTIDYLLGLYKHYNIP